MKTTPLALLAVIALALSLSGCKATQVTITGTVSGYRPDDRVFVTLSRSWKIMRTLPKDFEIDSTGAFRIELNVRSLKPPVTVVKNDEAIARFSLHGLGEALPVAYEELRGKAYELKARPDGTLKLHVEL
jgi:hypothetical protein